MMGPAAFSQVPNEGFALSVRSPQQPNYGSKPRRDRPWCEHYRKPGHTREMCWKIHGKPAAWKLARDRESQGHQVTVTTTTT